jgi:hypothetical protein
MALLGARALIDRAIPTGLDAGEILKFQLEDGRTAEQLIGEAAAMIGDLNTDLNSLYGGLWYVTERQYSRYANGQTARSQTPAKSEFKRADGVRSSMIGHMLPLNDYEDAVEWTPLYLRRAYGEDITADLQLITDRWRNRVDRDIFVRALTNTENAIGSAGYDVGWAIGAGVNVNYIPPQYGATLFGSSHTHYIVKDDSSLFSCGRVKLLNIISPFATLIKVFFLVVKGEMIIRLRDRDVALKQGEVFVVPKGVEHAPYAEHEAHVLLIEPTG